MIRDLNFKDVEASQKTCEANNGADSTAIVLIVSWALNGSSMRLIYYVHSLWAVLRTTYEKLIFCLWITCVTAFWTLISSNPASFSLVGLSPDWQLTGLNSCLPIAMANRVCPQRYWKRAFSKAALFQLAEMETQLAYLWPMADL